MVEELVPTLETPDLVVVDPVTGRSLPGEANHETELMEKVFPREIKAPEGADLERTGGGETRRIQTIDLVVRDTNHTGKKNTIYSNKIRFNNIST